MKKSSGHEINESINSFRAFGSSQNLGWTKRTIFLIYSLISRTEKDAWGIEKDAWGIESEGWGTESDAWRIEKDARGTESWGWGIGNDG